MPDHVTTVYRIDIVKNGQRWVDAFGVTATPDTIADSAVACVSEAAIESRPKPGDCSVAEVFDNQNRCIFRADLSISADI